MNTMAKTLKDKYLNAFKTVTITIKTTFKVVNWHEIKLCPLIKLKATFGNFGGNINNFLVFCIILDSYL